MSNKFGCESPCNCGETIRGILRADTYRPDKTGGWFQLEPHVICPKCFLNVKEIHIPDKNLPLMGIVDSAIDMDVWGEAMQ